MTKLFVLVVSLWGYNGSDWVYVGNQMSYKQPMSEEACEYIIDQFVKYEDNTYYRFSLECVEYNDK